MKNKEQRDRLLAELSGVVVRLTAAGLDWDAAVVSIARFELSNPGKWASPEVGEASAKAELAGHRHKWQDGKCVAVEGCAAKPRGTGKQASLPGA